MIRDEMDRIYRDMPPDKIPWNNGSPPAPLVELVNAGKIKPCEGVDLGCGAGNYTMTEFILPLFVVTK
jgi:hypothetical protein